MVRKLLIILFALNSINLKAQNPLSYIWDDSIIVLNGNDPIQVPWAGGINSAQVSTMDLDNDDREDLVIFDRTNYKLSTFLFSDTGYKYAPWYEPSFPEDLEGWVLLRDFNCDGKKDIFTHTPFGIKVYRNVSSGVTLPEWELIMDPIFTLGSSGQINLQVSILDLPGIDDLDGDGDLDILVYNFATGGGIEFHQNMSVENTSDCGLEFERRTKVWGNFLECECNIFAFGDELCENLESESRLKHIGGKTIMTFDMDDDGDKEVLIGQEDCKPLYFLENIGSPESALMTDFLLTYPNADNPISYFSFPAAYHEDLDGDGLKDLISSPNFSFNYENGLDFSNSFWFYKNIGTSSEPNFEFISQNYLQGEMIDVGESACPSLADYDRDGDLDLFISNKRNPDSEQLKGNICFYRNTGNPTKPIFQLETKDYMGIGNLGLSYLTHQFADMDLDGNDDLILMGSSDGLKSTIYILFNQSSSFFSFSISSMINLPQEFNVEDNFHFYPISNDPLPDLLVARSSGQLDYFRNSGSENFPQFTLDTESFLDIAPDFRKRKLDISVGDLDDDGNIDLLTSNEQGFLVWYSDFLGKTTVLGEEIFHQSQITSNPVKYNFGTKSFITTAPLFSDAEPSIIIGLQTGGIQILRKSNAQFKPGTEDPDLNLIIYPNPTMGLNRGIVSVSSSKEGFVQILSYTGQKISGRFRIQPGQLVQFDTNRIASGMYLVKFETGGGIVKTKHLVVIN